MTMTVVYTLEGVVVLVIGLVVGLILFEWLSKPKKKQPCSLVRG